MSTALAVLALVGLAVGVVLLVVVALLLTRVLYPILEINRYASDILEGGVGIAKNVDAVDELARTRDLVNGVPPLAVAYLKQAGAIE